MSLVMSLVLHGNFALVTLNNVFFSLLFSQESSETLASWNKSCIFAEGNLEILTCLKETGLSSFTFYQFVTYELVLIRILGVLE